MKEQRYNSVLQSLLSCMIFFVIHGCGAIVWLPAGSDLPPEVFYAAPMAEPPYYANSNFITGPVGYFDIVLDTVQERGNIFICFVEESECYSNTVRGYLKNALPGINEYYRNIVKDLAFVDRLPVNTNSKIDWRDYYYNEERDVYLRDLPEVHFGDPEPVLDEPKGFTFGYNNKNNNWLIAIQGRNVWFERFHDMYSENLELDYYLDIRVGLVEVTPHHTVVERSPFWGQVAEHRIGTDLTLNNEGRASSEWPINVIAFKGLLYNRTGEVVNAGVEGFIPMYPNTVELRPIEHTFNSLTQSEKSMNLITSTEDLDEINEYPWKQALDNLVRQLVYGGQ